MTKNCYIHIPFCKQKCNYCAFISYPCIDKITGYIFSLLKEITDKYEGEKLKTLYIGGGTPSLIPTNLLEKIIKKFSFTNNAEITIEVNPDDVTSELINKYFQLGINRISMGVQSLNDRVLKIAGRRHSAQQALDAIDIISNSKIKNLSCDLIYGLPEQTCEDFINDIKTLTNLSIQHISLYGLKIEENTPFERNLPTNLPDDDAQADMYIEACRTLNNNGFEQYEISNFAKPEMFSRHNINYWNNNSYYGFGVAAHGYVDGFRYYNTSNLEEYMNNPSVSEYAHHLTETERLEEEIFLGFRKSEGIKISEINKKFNINFCEKYKDCLTKYQGEYIVNDGTSVYFTTKGFLLSNIILAEFL